MAGLWPEIRGLFENIIVFFFPMVSGKSFFFNVSSAVMFPNLHFLRKSAYPQLPALPCTPLRSHFYTSPITTEVSRHVHSGAALPSSVFLPSESHLPCDWFPSLLSPPPSVDLYVGSHLCTWSIVEPASPERARLHSSCWIWRAKSSRLSGDGGAGGSNGQCRSGSGTLGQGDCGPPFVNVPSQSWGSETRGDVCVCCALQLLHKP